MNQRSFATLAVALGATLAAVSCGGSGSGPDGTREQIITVDGSSTVYPITEAVAEEFQQNRPGARVTVGISGTGGGFQKFCRGETDISDASRSIQPAEVEACAAGGIEFIELAVAYDGLAVLVNPANTWVESMTTAELKRLWEPDAQGKVTRWNHIRPDWPDREIHLYGAGVDSGTYDYFTEAIIGESGASRGDFTSSEDDNVLVQGIANDGLALGFFGYAYYEENQDKLKIVPIDDENDGNGKGPIAPTPDTVRTGTYQPLSRPIFIYVSVESLSRPEVVAFIDFYLAEGPALVREVGYVPLGDRGYELTRARFADRRTGTVFGAESHVGITIEDLLSRER